MHIQCNHNACTITSKCILYPHKKQCFTHSLWLPSQLARSPVLHLHLSCSCCIKVCPHISPNSTGTTLSGGGFGLVNIQLPHCIKHLVTSRASIPKNCGNLWHGQWRWSASLVLQLQLDIQHRRRNCHSKLLRHKLCVLDVTLNHFNCIVPYIATL